MIYVVNDFAIRIVGKLFKYTTYSSGRCVEVATKVIKNECFHRSVVDGNMIL